MTTDPLTEVYVKWNITWSPDQDVVYYVYNTTYIYVDTPCTADSGPICSYSQTDPITTVNAPLMGVIQILMNLDSSPLERIVFDALLEVLNTKQSGAGGSGSGRRCRCVIIARYE